MHSFKDLKVWNKARSFTIDLYSAANGFPKEEVYGLTSQLKRATISISNNIAEGAGRKSPKEFKQFLSIAYGSSFEVENMIILAFDLNFFDEETQQKLLKQLLEIQKMLFALIKSIK